MSLVAATIVSFRVRCSAMSVSLKPCPVPRIGLFLRLAGTTYEMLNIVHKDCGSGTVVKHLPQFF